MRIQWIAFIAILSTLIGCVPPTRIQNIHIQMDQPYTGEVGIFNSFDEIGKSYEEVADLYVSDYRPLNNKNRNRLIDSLKSAARDLGAEGIVIIKEGESVRTVSAAASGGPSKEYKIFINSVAVVYR
jgi:hypothetical protein